MQTGQKSVARFINLLEVAKENEQPINLTLSAGDFLQALDYSVEMRLAAERERAEKEKELEKMCDEVTPTEARAMLHVSAATLWRYAKENLITKKSIGGKIYYSRKELTKFMGR